MGSFDVGCMVSGLAIHPDDQVVFIPLIKSAYDIEMTSLGYVTNAGALAQFRPMTLPIRGWYGDYGRIEEFSRSPYWCRMDAIGPRREAYFGRPTPQRYGTWVHGDVYHLLASGLLPAESGKPREPAWTYEYVTPDVLERLGFVLDRANLDTKTFKFPSRNIEISKIAGKEYTHEKLPNFRVLSRGEFSNYIDVYTDKPNQELAGFGGIYDVLNFLTRIKEKFGVDLDPGELDKMTSSQWYLQIVKDRLLNKYPEGDVSTKQAILTSLHVESNCRYAIEDSGDRGVLHTIQSAMGLVTRDTHANSEGPLLSLSVDDIKSGEMDEEIAGFSTFLSNLSACNRLLQPSWCSWQYGNDYASRDLAGVITSILYERMN